MDDGFHADPDGIDGLSALMARQGEAAAIYLAQLNRPGIATSDYDEGCWASCSRQ